MKRLMKRHNSIQFRIPFYISIYALICVLLTGIFLQVVFRSRLEENIESKNMIISEMISNELSLYLENASDTVITAANFSSQSSGDLEQVKSEIFRIYDNFKYFDLIFFMNEKAQMVFSKPSNENVQGRLYTDRDYYWDIMKEKKESAISKLLVSSVLNAPHFIIAAPVKNTDDEIIGLIGSGIPLSNIEKIVDNSKIGFDGKIWITDALGSLVIHPDFDIDKEIISISELGIKVYDDEKEIYRILENGEGISAMYAIDSEAYYASISFLEDYNWMIVVEQNKSTVSREILDTTSQIFAIQGLVLLFALIIGLVLARWITLPINQLVQQVRVLSSTLKSNRNITLSKDVSKGNEISELSLAFNEMGMNLKENLTNLENSVINENRTKQYLKNILASVHSGIIVADSKGEITIFNAQATKITGFDSGDMISHNFFRVLEILDLNIKSEIENVIQYDQQLTDRETTMNTISNKAIVISYTCTRVIDPSGNNLGIVFQFRDITTMKILEQELRKEDRIYTIGELSSSIIHDIGNPLAGMANLIELLKDEEISKDSQIQLLDLLGEEVNDLNILVINFLDFVRSSDVQKRPTDLIKTINNCLDLLKGEIDTNRIRLIKHFPDKPIILNFESRSIKQAIINILKNATQAIDVLGLIRISVIESDDAICLTIEDDGKGMSEETLSKLFHPFYTTKEKGTGLGLFIAYNALKENGCTLSVVSEKSSGTIFKIFFKRD